MTAKTRKRNLFVSAFALLTVSAMSLFFSLYEPWVSIGSELIPDGSFSTPAATNAWSGWGERTRLIPDGGFGGSPGVVLTTSSNQNGVLRFTVYNLTNIPAFRVSLRAAAQGVARGKEGYHVPRAIFFYHDAKGKGLFSLHHGVTDISKDTGWRYYKDFFPVPNGAIDARLHIQNLGIAGTMQIDDLSVIPVRERHSSPWWKLFFGTLWMTAFGLCLFILRPWARRHGVLILITLALIMIGIVLPGKVLDGAIEKSIHTAKSLLPKPAKPMPPAQTVKAATAPEQSAAPKPVKPKEEPAILFVGTGVDNTHLIGHFAMFSLLAFFSALSWLAAPPSLKRTVSVFAGLTFFAAATEVLQYIPSDRAAALSDLRVDTVGMAGAVVLVFAIRHLQRLITRV
jgi:VanZ family protein